jgi:hypothetical protein
MRIFYFFVLLVAVSIGFYIYQNKSNPEIKDIKKYSDTDYLYENIVDSKFSKQLLLGQIFNANDNTIDSLIKDLKEKQIVEFSLDVYGFQLGPIYDTLGIRYPSGIGNHYWELGQFFTIPTLEHLEINSVCSYNFYISHPNTTLTSLHIGSHSCDFVKSKNPTRFSNLKILSQISFHRIELTQSDLEEISKINSLSVFIANDCMLDLEYLLPLKNQLKYIDLTKSLVSNIHLISEFKNLEVVYLGGTSTTDFTWFVGMSNLKGLSVKRNKLSNYEALNQLNKLQKLFVSKSSINSLPIDMLKKKDTEVVIID